MANYNTNLIPWGDSGQLYPTGYSYLQGEQPVDDWDNFFNTNVYNDLDHLISLTNSRIESNYGSTGGQPSSPDAAHLYVNTDTNTLQLWDPDASTWDAIARRDQTIEQAAPDGTDDSAITSVLSNKGAVRLVPGQTYTISSQISTSSFSNDELTIDARGATIDVSTTNGTLVDDSTSLTVIGGEWQNGTIGRDTGSGGRLIVDKATSNGGNSVILESGSKNAEIEIQEIGSPSISMSAGGDGHRISITSTGNCESSFSTVAPLSGTTLDVKHTVSSNTDTAMVLDEDLTDVDIDIAMDDPAGTQNFTDGVSVQSGAMTRVRVNNATFTDITDPFSINPTSGIVAVRGEDGTTGKPVWLDGTTGNTRSAMTQL
jgi:hypothetical protein